MRLKGMREYLVLKQVLTLVVESISRETGILHRRDSAAANDSSQMFQMCCLSSPLVLSGLCQLFTCFMSEENIVDYFKSNEDLVKMILNATVRLQCLVLQKTKASDDCAATLSDFMEDTFASNEKDIGQLLIAHVDAFRKAAKSERRLSRFVLKHLCNVIRPEQAQQDCSVYLRKDRAQEEFIRGDMKPHPYSTKALPGPLMRDIVQKIVIDSNMETPTDMFELLVVCTARVSLYFVVKLHCIIHCCSG